MEKLKTVYLVKQFQEQTDFWDSTIYVYSTKKKADEVCQKLNDEYEDGRLHYYEVEAIGLDEEVVYY